MGYNPNYTPSGTNNRDNAWYQKHNHVRIAKGGSTRSELGANNIPPELTAFTIDNTVQPNSTIALAFEAGKSNWTTIYWQLDSTVSYATPAAMDAAQGTAKAYGNFGTPLPQNVDLTSVTPDGSYYLHMYAENGSGKQTGAPVSQACTVDNTAPVLSAADGNATGPSSATLDITSDSLGTIYAAVRLTSQSALTKSEIKNGTGNAQDAQSASAVVGVNSFLFNGLTGSGWTIDVYQDDGRGNESAVISEVALAGPTYGDIVSIALRNSAPGGPFGVHQSSNWHLHPTDGSSTTPINNFTDQNSDATTIDGVFSVDWLGVGTNASDDLDDAYDMMKGGARTHGDITSIKYTVSDINATWSKYDIIAYFDYYAGAGNDDRIAKIYIGSEVYWLGNQNGGTSTYAGDNWTQATATAKGDRASGKNYARFAGLTADSAIVEMICETSHTNGWVLCGIQVIERTD